MENVSIIYNFRDLIYTGIYCRKLGSLLYVTISLKHNFVLLVLIHFGWHWYKTQAQVSFPDAFIIIQRFGEWEQPCIEDSFCKWMTNLLLQTLKNYKPQYVKWGKDTLFQHITYESLYEVLTDINHLYFVGQCDWLIRIWWSFLFLILPNTTKMVSIKMSWKV